MWFQTGGIEDKVKDRLDVIEERTGLETDFDDIEITSLPEDVPARTRYEPNRYGMYGKTTLELDREDISYFDDSTLDNALTHEVLEKHQFEGDLGRKLREEHGISDDLAQKIRQTQRYAPNSKREGMTQALTNQLSEGGETAGRYFYLYETLDFEKELETQGFELQEELLEEETDQTVTDPVGHDVYVAVQGENFYAQAGIIGDLDYQLWITGDGVQDYLQELDGYFGQETYGDSDSGLDYEAEFETDYFEEFGNHRDRMEKEMDMDYNQTVEIDPEATGTVTLENPV